MKTQVVKKENKLPSVMNEKELESLLNKSFDNIDSTTVTMPFFRIVALQSPVLQPGNPAYKADAKPGMIYNTVQDEFYDGQKGILVIPSLLQMWDLEWEDRGQSNRPVARHSPRDNILAQTVKDEMGKNRLPSGNYIETTAHHYVTRLDDNMNAVESGLITMSRTQLKKSSKWNAGILMKYHTFDSGKKIQLSNHAQVYRITTALEKNSKGNWYGWVINFVGLANSNASLESQKLRDSMIAEKRELNLEGLAENETVVNGVTTADSQGNEKTPF